MKITGKPKTEAGHKVSETKEYHISNTKDTTLYSSVILEESEWDWTKRTTFIYLLDSVSIVNETRKSERKEYDSIALKPYLVVIKKEN